jgi:dihydrofolate reductase
MVIIIAAIASNNALGKDNQLIWHLPADLKRFKSTTLGQTVVMGRKTFESLGKALPNRNNIVITRNKNFIAADVTVVHSLKQALEISKGKEKIYILGGAEIYTQALPFADLLDLTLVHADVKADTFFPVIDQSIWKEIRREDHKKDDKNTYDYSFVTYKKSGP